MTVDDMWRKNRRDNPGTTCDGVDLNRNADIVWGVAQGQTSCSPCADVYCGPSAFSEPETRNVKHVLDTRACGLLRRCALVFRAGALLRGAMRRHNPPTRRKRFTGLTTGTCTASIPASYSEYMPPRDVQRFRPLPAASSTTWPPCAAATTRPQTSLALYATTGTQSDYAYSRHIANPSLNKTYGFTFETGPGCATARRIVPSGRPQLIKRDAKAAMLALLQQSVCAIELIGLRLFEGEHRVHRAAHVRDKLLATTAAGREWITLFERAQFAMLDVGIRQRCQDAGHRR